METFRDGESLANKNRVEKQLRRDRFETKSIPLPKTPGGVIWNPC